MSKTGTNPIIGGGFHHVAVRAWDFEKSIQFYTEALGFTQRYGWGADERESGGKDTRAVMLDTGDGNYMELFAGGTRPPDQESPEGPILHFAFRTDDCAHALERARQAGAVITMETKTVPIAGDPPTDFTIAFCKGPDNEIIEFFQNPML